MDYMEDKTLFFMDIAKDEKGREAIEYGYESQDDYKNHLIRAIFNRDEQRILDLLLLELMKQFDIYIGNDEMTSLDNCNVTKAIEISKQFARETTGSKKVFEKFIEQLENASAYKSDVFFG